MDLDFRMSTVSPSIDVTCVNDSLGNQTLVNMRALQDTTNPIHVVPWGMVILYALFTLAIMAGNGLVIVGVYRLQFLQTLTNVFIVGVAATDLTFSIMGLMKIVELVAPNLLAGYGACLFRQTLVITNGVMTATMLLCKTRTNGVHIVQLVT